MEPTPRPPVDPGWSLSRAARSRVRRPDRTVAGAPMPTPTDPESARFLMFDAVAGLLRVVAARTPARRRHRRPARRRSSVAARARLSRAKPVRRAHHVRDHPSRTRGELRSRASRSRSSSWDGRPAASRCADSRRRTSSDLIENAAGCRPSDALVTRIHDATDGNPFFVDEILRMLADDGQLCPDGDASSALGIPGGVREAVRLRLDSTSPESVAVLEVAAVIGREFDASVVRMAGDEPDLLRVLEALESPVRHGLVIEVPGAVGRFQFRHALIREVLYESLAPARRLRLHRRVGEALARAQRCRAGPLPRRARAPLPGRRALWRRRGVRRVW